MSIDHPFITTIRAELAAQADSERAAKMAAYMKTDQPFYGVQSKPTQAIFRDTLKKHPITTHADYESIIWELWNGIHREEMYQALRVAEIKKFWNINAWHIYERLVHEATWWDTLDWLAGTHVGLLILKHRELESRLIEWRTDDHLWTRRASLLAHLKHKQKTNVPLLAETILLLAHESDFFIRKAIGWVLREYSKTDAAWVTAFIQTHDAVLSSLSKREGMKVILRNK